MHAASLPAFAMSHGVAPGALVARSHLPWPLPARSVVVDTRRRAVCVRRSVAGGLCLNPRMLLTSRGRLASWRNVRWLLGALRLTGAETAIVVGDRARRENFVAGMLYVAGQRRVEVVADPVTAWLARHPGALGAGTTRGVFREAIYTAWPRTRLVVLRQELAARPPTGGEGYLPVDGRARGRYRLGHIPGARSLPMADVGRDRTAMRSLIFARRPVVAYGAGPYGSMAYFARLRMLAVRARVFAGGWRDWTRGRGVRARPGRTPGLPAPDKSLAVASVGAAIAAIMVLVWRMTRRR